MSALCLVAIVADFRHPRSGGKGQKSCSLAFGSMGTQSLNPIGVLGSLSASVQLQMADSLCFWKNQPGVTSSRLVGAEK